MEVEFTEKLSALYGEDASRYLLRLNMSFQRAPGQFHLCRSLSLGYLYQLSIALQPRSPTVRRILGPE